MPRDNTYWIGFALVTASAIAWSTAGFFTRLIPLDTATTLFWRGMFGGLGLLIVALAMGRRRGLTGFRRMGAGGWLFAVVSALGMLCFIAALKTTSVAHVAVVYAVVPFVAAGFGWLALRERPGASAVVASMAALAGVVIMVGFGADGTILGDLLAFGMTVCMAAMMVISRRFQDIPMLPAACISAVLSALAVLPWAAPLSVSGTEWGLLAAFGLVNSAIGLALFTAGSKRLPPVETALIGALDAPLAPIWVWLAFAETPSVPTLIGGVIVFAAVMAHLTIAARRVA